jgi:hypothetical protein
VTHVLSVLWQRDGEQMPLLPEAEHGRHRIQEGHQQTWAVKMKVWILAEYEMGELMKVHSVQVFRTLKGAKYAQKRRFNPCATYIFDFEVLD